MKLSADGKIRLYNHAGTVDVLADVVGFYTDKSLKELTANVYTKAEVDALLAGKVDHEVGSGVLSLSGSAFQPTTVPASSGVFNLWRPRYDSWAVSFNDPTTTPLQADLTVGDGAAATTNKLFTTATE